MTLFVSENTKRDYLDMLIGLIAEKIAITKSMYDSAISQYNGITQALDVPALSPFKPVLRVQGSMRLGTSVRSYLNDNDFDVDIIIELRSIPLGWTQKRVKELILEHLLKHPTYGPMIKVKEGGRRCVTIEYANNSHVDVLPSVISDKYIRAIEYRSSDFYSYQLAITDKKDSGYSSETDVSRWPQSNPIGYADWFQSIAERNEARHKSALMVRAEIEAFPHYKEAKDKNTLQKIIMLLKRHRDMLMGTDEDKPVSILLTTLAAKAYANSPNAGIFQTLCWVVEHMMEEIHCQNGRPVVLNPVNPQENFADKWPEKPLKQKKFYNWYNQLVEDIKAIQQLSGPTFNEKLRRMFGETAVKQAREQEGKNAHIAIVNKNTSMAANGNWGANDGKISKPHTFYENNKPYLLQPDPKWIPAHSQLKILLNDFPGTTIKKSKDGIYSWFWDCSPTPCSDTYKVRIEFAEGRIPRVQILSPSPLPKPHGVKLYEHINHPQELQFLCLHLPGEWKGHMIIADTFVPWTSEWLYSYEIWLETGVWTGEGHRRDTHN